MGDATAEKSGDSLNGSDNNVVDVELNQERPAQVPAGTTERKIMAKIDLHVIPVLCIMYLLAFLGMFLPCRYAPRALTNL